MAIPARKEGVSDWTGIYTLPVEHWTASRVNKKYSPEFEVGGYLWKLLVLKKGHETHGSADFIAAYLEFQEADYTPRRMCPRVKFELMAVKRAKPGNSQILAATHTFTADAKVCGSTQFIRRQEVLNPRNGYLRGNTWTLKARIKICDDDPGLKSKLETGFVGIKSQEETSLLNSLLQCLYHIEALRKAVLQTSTAGFDDLQEPLPLPYQSLFYELKHQETSVKIKDVIKALDLDVTNVGLRHDVEGTQRKLLETLEKHDRDGRLKACISELFVGQYSNYVQSPSIQESQKCEQHSFMGIPLDILECKDIYSSLEKFCQIDRVEENKQSHDIEESKHCIRFDNFPPILSFFLKRCYCNPDCGAICKINSHYEFYDELDLDYKDRILLSKNADQTIENKYRLHSVLAQTDGPGGGQYFTFIRRAEKWYKFDGEIVKAVPSEEAINQQFGDEDSVASANFSEEFESINKSAAVMLVYIRKSERERVMYDYGMSCLPNQSQVALEKERKEEEEEEERLKMEQEAHRYVIIKLATEFHFMKNIGNSYYCDLVDFDFVETYRIPKKTPFEDFKEMVRKDFKVLRDHQRFWKWSKRKNNTIRVSKPLMRKDIEVKTVLDLRYLKSKNAPHEQDKTALMTFKIFLESPEEGALKRGIFKSTIYPIQRKKLMIFLKYYDPESSKLSYLGHMFIEPKCPLCLILERGKKLAGLAPETTVVGFNEVKHLPTVVCTKLSPTTTANKAKVIHGDIIIIQKLASNAHCEYPTVKSFLDRTIM